MTTQAMRNLFVGVANLFLLLSACGDSGTNGGSGGSSDGRTSTEGGAQAKNVFWQVSGEVTGNTTAHLEGVALSRTAITLRTRASVRGRLFGQTSVDLDSSTVTQPAR